MTPRTVLILCERAPVKVNPVPAVLYRTFPEEEDGKMSPLLDGDIARTTRSSSAESVWKCSYCGRRVQVVA